MTREVQPVVLVLVGAAILRISVGDAYLRYVKEGLQPFLIASAVVLILLGLVSAWRDLDRGGSAGTAGGPDDPEAAVGHAHETGPRVAWMLLLPVAAILLVAPPALGADAASRDSGTVAAPAAESEFAELPEGDPVDLRLDDYAIRACWGGAATLEGRQVRMTGFVTPMDGGGWYLTRIALACCAADGQAVKVEVRDAPAPPADTWVQLTGTYVPSGAEDPRLAPAVVRATAVAEVEAPRNPYL